MKISWLSRLADLFSAQAQDKEKSTVGPKKTARQEAFERLKEWLEKLPQDLTAKLDEARDSKHYTKFDYIIDVESAHLTQKDMVNLMPLIEAAHDICMKNDVFFELAGLRSKPGTETSYDDGMALAMGPAVVAFVDTGKTYDMHAHPKMLEMKKAGREIKGSRKRPRKNDGLSCSFNPAFITSRREPPRRNNNNDPCSPL